MSDKLVQANPQRDHGQSGSPRGNAEVTHGSKWAGRSQVPSGHRETAVGCKGLRRHGHSGMCQTGLQLFLLQCQSLQACRAAASQSSHLDFLRAELLGSEFSGSHCIAACVLQAVVAFHVSHFLKEENIHQEKCEQSANPT